MKLRRTPYEMAWQILDYCIQPRKLTHVIRACNLNTNRAKKYLDLLIARQMISKSDDEYKTTKDGTRYINLMKEAYETLFSGKK